MRLAIYETMGQREGSRETDQRLGFIVDELDALGPIDGLKDALARLRKFGGRCVLGFQSIAQVSGTYGHAEAQTIVENCGNTLILRCSSSENGGTARFASKLIGEREVMREQTTTGRSVTTYFAPTHSSTSTSIHHVTESAVLPSEIEQLPDLRGYLKCVDAGVEEGETAATRLILCAIFQWTPAHARSFRAAASPSLEAAGKTSMFFTPRNKHV
jgi:type IV secretory pathway TraG/TraD family ATPase VirD4